MTLQSNGAVDGSPAMDAADVAPMSNMAAIRDHNNAQLRTLAIGEGLGKRAIGEFFVLVSEQIGRGEREFSDTGPLAIWRYDVIRAEEGRCGIVGDDLTKKPEGNSLASQLTKARTITALGMIERKRSGVIECLRTVAKVPGCQWAYKPLVVAARAINEAYVADPLATDGDLIDAAQTAIDNIDPPKAKTLETELAKMLKSFEKLETGAFEADMVRANKRVAEDVSGNVRKTLTRLLNATKAVAADDALYA